VPCPAGERGTSGENIQRRWDLWNLKTLFPRWGSAELDSLLRLGQRFDDRQRQLFADPAAAAKTLCPRAEQVFADHPDLTTGLTLSLHLGPYSLASVPWLVAGHDIHLLINQSSLRGIKPTYDTLCGVLRLPGTVVWEPVDGPGFALRLWRALRRGKPVFAYLDGNDGLGGADQTLNNGVIHHLPGRDIRVRTGLARLALRLGCPVHTLVTVWSEAGGFEWVRGPTWQWAPGTSATRATGDLFGWGFGIIRQHPAQWRAWNMLTAVYDSFRPGAGSAPPVACDPWSLLQSCQAERPLRWYRQVVLWPGQMLEDVRESCFYDSGGISVQDLARLQDCEVFTPCQVAAMLGVEWLAEHLVRLVALGFVGPLQPDKLAAEARTRNPG